MNTRSTRRSPVVGLVLFILGAGGGWAIAQRGEAAENTTSAVIQTAEVGPRSLAATVLATGVIRPQVGAQVAVGSRISGVLRRVHVTSGQRVEAGQLLAELDPAEAQTSLDRAEAVLATAVAEEAFSQREYDRAQTLSAREFIPAAELSAALRAVETNAARVREARAAVASARVQLGYTEIRAPISGVVGTVSTQEGETIAASLAAPTFLTIVDLSRLELWAYIDETDVGLVAAGQRATFTVSTFPDAEFGGRVVAIRPTADVIDNVVTYITRIAIDRRGNRQLRPEMTATLRIARDGREAALAVPNAALRRDAEGSFVLVLAATGIERRPVQVGFRGSEHSEILDGLSAGERVTLGAQQGRESPREESQR
jgi:HlyD family secretion protein